MEVNPNPLPNPMNADLGTYVQGEPIPQREPVQRELPFLPPPLLPSDKLLKELEKDLALPQQIHLDPALAQHLMSLRHKSPESRSFIEKKLLKAQDLDNAWLQISKLAREEEYQLAYDLALKDTDSIYLLRLMAQTGPVLHRLNTETGRRVLDKVNRVCRSGTLLKLEVEWLEGASRAKAFRKMNRDE